MVEKIIEGINSGEILLADAKTPYNYYELFEQGLLLDDEFAAKIAGNWFYFKSRCKGKLLHDYDTREIARMIADVINNSEENGLDDAEVELYRLYLG